MAERKRSHFAWGFEDAFPTDERRGQLAGLVGPLLQGSAVPVLRPLPRIEDARVPEASLEVPAALAAIASADREVRLRHAMGRGYRDLVRAFAGDFASAPDLVATPRTEDDLERVLAWAEAAGCAVIPWGGGTSVVGGVDGARPAGKNGVVSLDLGAFDRVLEVDAVSRTARIQAGCTGPALEAQLRTHGLTLRFFPQSFELSTLGGWIATRAGGHYATAWTHIDDLTQAVTMLTPRGWWSAPRVPASGAGPSPDRMVLGSEGILGVITEAWMRVVPRPTWRVRATVRCGAWDEAVGLARSIVQAGCFPQTLRVLDAAEAMLAGLAPGPLVLIGFEASDADPSPQMARALAHAKGLTVEGPKLREGDRDEGGTPGVWKAAFLDMPYLQSALVSLGVLADTFETACTWAAFPALDAAVRAAVSAAGCPLISCRFTHVYPDGPAPYYTFVGPVRVGEELDTWARVKQAASDALAAHGGTITHHHAIGRTHRPWYDRELPAPFAAALAGAKAALDPAGMLNPGVLLG